MLSVIAWLLAGAMLFVVFSKRFDKDTGWKALVLLMLNMILVHLSIIADLLRPS